MRGRLVLAVNLDPDPPRGPGRALNADGSALAEERKPITGVELVAAERPVSEWLRPVIGKPGTFRIEGVGRDLSAEVGVVKGASTDDRDVELGPFYRLHRRTC